MMGGCNLPGTFGLICTEEFRYGLSVYVRDSVTDAAIASGARMVTMSNGVVVDSGVGPPSAWPANQAAYNVYPLSGAGERKGTYTVTVSKPGYRDWVRSNVIVTADECHVRGVVLTARLQAAP